jgi:phosphoserine phosphatase RsbU/P
MKQQALMFMILSLSILVAYVFVKRIAQPLNLLAEHAKTLAYNDFAAGLNIPTEVEALSKEPKDEIGNLAGSFIYMERTLQQSARGPESRPRETSDRKSCGGAGDSFGPQSDG